MGTSSRGNNVRRGWPPWTCGRPHALPPPAVAGPLAVLWPAIPDRWGLPGCAGVPQVAWQVGHRAVRKDANRLGIWGTLD
jgi:hypothetical protein